MRFRRQKDRDIAALDIAPLVDVVFLLLIFFLLSMGEPVRQTRVQLPEASTGGHIVKQAIYLVIAKDGIFLDGKPCSINETRSLPMDKDIIIEAQRDIPYYRVVRVLDALRVSGHKRISLATRFVRPVM